MNRLLDAALVAIVLAASVGYALYSLGPKTLRRRLRTALADLAARAPAALHLGGIERRLREAAGGVGRLRRLRELRTVRRGHARAAPQGDPRAGREHRQAAHQLGRPTRPAASFPGEARRALAAKCLHAFGEVFGIAELSWSEASIAS